MSAIMQHLAHTLLIVSIVASTARCSPAPPEAPPSPTATGGERKATQGIARYVPACQGAASPERLTIAASGAATTRSGMTIRFSGAQHDHYDDGHTDFLLGLELSVAGGATSHWMPSAFAAPAYHAFGDYCVRIAKSSNTHIVVDVAPLPTAPSRDDLPHCHVSCCSVEERAPSPEGSIECCFCDAKKP